MSPQVATAVMLALAGCLGTWRAARSNRRSAAVWLQAPVAILLYLGLFPPSTSIRGDAMTVLTADATAPPRRSIPDDRIAVALPGAIAPLRAESVPDLATALRRYPDVHDLTVVGSGLSARDRPAASQLSVRFNPSPERGLVELLAPAMVLLGHQWTVRGRAAAPAVRVELHDPSGAVVDAAKLDGGRFSLSASARGVGNASFELQLFDAKQTLLDSASVPVTVIPGQPMVLIVRAGAVNPEMKYWIRWATDAGISLKVTTGLTEGVALRDGDAQLTPASLAQADLVSIDARAWQLLDAAEKTALASAVDRGLGLLLRADGPVDTATAADWSALGYVLEATAARSVTMDGGSQLHERVSFTVAPMRASSTGEHPVWQHPMLEADDGTALAWWHTQGEGRIGLWLLLDSYQLALLGQPARYATLWADVLDQLARPRAAPAPQPIVPLNAWIDERVVFCGLAGSSSVLTSSHAAAPLLADASGCAAYWPAEPGWYTLRTAGSESAFYVRAAGDGRGLRAARDRDATAGMVGTSENHAPVTSRHAPLSRWPFFAAWLIGASALWWLEKGMAGHRVPYKRSPASPSPGRM